MNEEFTAFEAPKIEPPEFRLYYNEDGSVKYYCGDKSGVGNYIVIDSKTFAEARHDIKVVDGEIQLVKAKQILHKLVPANDGLSCHKDDVSVVVEDNVDAIKWELISYEL